MALFVEVLVIMMIMVFRGRMKTRDHAQLEVQCSCRKSVEPSGYILLKPEAQCQKESQY